jgi:hypothetical protein
MQALAGFLLLGIVIGYARGGRIGELGRARLHHAWLLVVALVMQLVANEPEQDWLALALVLGSFGVIGVFAAINRRAFGMPLVALGAAMNFIVIAANGGMPVSAEAIRAVGDDPASLVLRGKHFVDHGQAHLRFLSDTIAWPLRPAIVSVGDLVLWSGISLLVAGLMQPRAHEPERMPWVEVH